jgi:YVTN family beta-propeller protein
MNKSGKKIKAFVGRVTRVWWMSLPLVAGGASAAGEAPFAYVANFIDNTVSVIDTATNTVVASVYVGGGGPDGVAITPF